MLNKFAQWCDWVAKHRNFGGRMKIPGTAALLMGILGLPSPAAADVGLPQYQPTLEPDHALHQLPAHGPVLKKISHGDPGTGLASLDCGRSAATALDMAPPGDKRVDVQVAEHGAVADELPIAAAAASDPANISVLLSGSSAVVRIGEVLNAVRAHRHAEATVLTSDERNYFNRLRDVRPVDTLLVEDSQTVRRYRVRASRIVPLGEDAPGLDDNLVLAACYPFQALGGPPLLYMVLAEPIPAPVSDSSQSKSEGKQGGRYETLRF